MNILNFTVPPLLYYIVSGFHTFSPGHYHMSRHNTRVFDLLVVKQGCLYMSEGGLPFQVKAGQALLLRPDSHHFSTDSCKESTSYYWLHFQTVGEWNMTEDTAAALEKDNVKIENSLQSDEFDIRPFSLRLPQYTTLLQPSKIEELLSQLNQLVPNSHLSDTPFQQQLLFQEVIQQLSASLSHERPSPSKTCAEQAASYLRSHFREHITAQQLGESLSFHPVYIARCMKKEYGCAPMEYLLHYRIQQSKLLLMQTSYTIARIAEEVGFNQAPYFSSSFIRIEGTTPREFRQRFS
ncbi:MULTISPECIES: AraC family transcriptional regulator [Paenibacillus]|jgi:YesN/AraC family two-component response regulator|uniref:AraC family transcriptional regulator n=1 Tax=Paenibacillus odorifer TaxID=189426 RepID=A0A1R0XEJ9_9BACL|nr:MULTISPECIES: AraC family transcriptional regulator [Paenibacillus]AIQ76426.1 AraC family transcriptional regulator [Paenibacillus odorifer]ETT50592.1 AraC family transcriptional regulator [Paenibacillus sp. FSL H8-237]MEC0131109.1 AraC family transcriptional regulator [Paenibacillus odorifer]MEC0221410.1 AraC family transcriptional regulator [Paenibacillus odorifer]OMD16832.1 AraC family transcriptional regulator [Paenibacillus odorifer]